MFAAALLHDVAKPWCTMADDGRVRSQTLASCTAATAAVHQRSWLTVSFGLDDDDGLPVFVIERTAVEVVQGRRIDPLHSR